MMRKKHLTQFDNSLNKNKEVNAKVTVEYIREQQLIKRPQNSGDLQQQHNMLLNTSQDDLESENVEYLEDNPNTEEYIDEPSEKGDFEDNFYPNAIHCLLDLYKSKYENLCMEAEEIKVVNIWHDIAKNMQESFFEFNEKQIQQKFLLLREQYFAVQTKEDIDNFDYFEQLHDIYKDPNKKNIIKGLEATTKKESVYHKDEIFLNSSHLANDHNNHMSDFKSDEIVHKEHEFIDMVEKELQAMEGGGMHRKIEEQNLNEENPDLNGEDKTCYNDCNFDNQELRLKLSAQNFKKPFPSDSESKCDGPPNKKEKFEKYLKIDESINNDCSTVNGNDFSLFLYNQQQERRHKEKMSMLEKYLQVQERSLEQQQQILQELIKRLPS